jgi:septation ring formation regulator EzrA
MQSFENSLKELEPSDSVKRKIQEKNQRLRAIVQQMDEIHTKQMDIRNESEQYRDTIRFTN